MWNHHGLPPDSDGGLLTRDNIYDDEEELLSYKPSSSSGSSSSAAVAVASVPARFLGPTDARNGFLSNQLAKAHHETSTTSAIMNNAVNPSTHAVESNAPPTGGPSASSSANSLWASQQHESAFGATTSSATRRVQSRFSSWNQNQNPEEEREEEALPSYLSYLAAPFNGSATAAQAAGLSTRYMSQPPHPNQNPTRSHTPPASAAMFAGGGGGLKCSPHGARHPPPPGLTDVTQQPQQRAPSSQFQHPHQSSSFYPGPPNGMMPGAAVGTNAEETIEVKTRELAHAFRAFISSQFDQLPASQRNPGASTGVCTCGCNAMQARLVELENQMKRMLQQQTTNRKGMGMGPDQKLSSGRGGASPSPGGAIRNAPVAGAGAGAGGAAVGGGAGSNAGDAAAALMNDRVSTLEGRQSAFQSQLAQISRVLGIPVGKAGKHQQQAIRTLVQSLREEIDTRVKATTTELETKLQISVETQVQQQLKDSTKVPASETPAATGGDVTRSSSLPSGFGSYEQVLEVLAQEHEASLKKLSEYFEERLQQEQEAREKAEKRSQRRLDQQEEWLQQLEAAAAGGGSHINFVKQEPVELLTRRRRWSSG